MFAPILVQINKGSPIAQISLPTKWLNFAPGKNYVKFSLFGGPDWPPKTSCGRLGTQNGSLLLLVGQKFNEDVLKFHFFHRDHFKGLQEGSLKHQDSHGAEGGPRTAANGA